MLAPGKKLSETSASTCLSGGCVRETLYIVKMYSEDMQRATLEASARRPRMCGQAGVS